MTAPLHARDIPAKGRYYSGCQEGCPLGSDLYMSVTNAQGIVDKPALAPAAAKATADAAWNRLPQMVATSRQTPAGDCAKAKVVDRCGHCRFCVTAAIKAEYRQVWESRAELGTRVHALAHAHVIGQPSTPDEEAQPFVDQYLRFLEDFRVDLDRDVEAAETTVFDPTHLYAGTGDIWLKLPGFGTGSRRGLVLVDIKTSLTKPANAVYRDQILQLAGLRYAPHAVLVDDTEVKVPAFAGAALLNLRTSDYALIPLPADGIAMDAFLAAVNLQRFFHDQVDTKTWVPTPAPITVERKAS